MSYNVNLAGQIRKYLHQYPELLIEEKKMFGGLAFMVNGKMCINASGENLMCRFDPEIFKEVSNKKGFLPMNMKGKEYKGYCYVKPEGFITDKDFEYWMKLCLDFNTSAKKSGKKE